MPALLPVLRKTLALLLVLMIFQLLSLSGCRKAGGVAGPAGSTGSTGSTGDSVSADRLEFGIMPDVDSIPVIIAQSQGYFEKEGAKVSLQLFRSAMDRDSALQSGQMDGVISDALAAAFAVQGGMDVRITSQTNGSYKLLAGKDTDIPAIQDLAGRSIGISKNTIIEYVTDRMTAEAGTDPAGLNKIIIKDIPARLEMLQQGKIDAATLPEPLASVAIGNGARILGSSDQLGVNPGIMLFKASSVTGKANAIAAFYRAYDRAVDYLRKTPLTDFSGILIAEASFPENIAKTMVLPEYTHASPLPDHTLAQVHSWLLERELITADTDLKKLLSIRDDRFLGKQQ